MALITTLTRCPYLTGKFPIPKFYYCFTALGRLHKAMYTVS